MWHRQKWPHDHKTDFIGNPAPSPLIHHRLVDSNRLSFIDNITRKISLKTLVGRRKKHFSIFSGDAYLKCQKHRIKFDPSRFIVRWFQKPSPKRIILKHRFQPNWIFVISRSICETQRLQFKFWYHPNPLKSQLDTIFRNLEFKMSLENL